MIVILCVHISIILEIFEYFRILEDLGYWCGYYELEGLPHHSFDVFFHGESISDRFTSVWALHPSTWVVESQHNPTVLWIIFGNIVYFHWFPLNFIGFHWISIDFHWITDHFRSSLATLGSWNRLIEWPNTCKSIGNGFLMKKYVGAVVRKSFQITIAAEQDHFKNFEIYRNMHTKS